MAAKPRASGDSVSITIDVDDVAMIRVLGVHDRVLNQVEAECPGVVVVARGNSITVSGSEAEVDKAHALITDVVALARAGVDLAAADVTRASRIKAQTGKGAASFLS